MEILVLAALLLPFVFTYLFVQKMNALIAVLQQMQGDYRRIHGLDRE